MKDTTVIFCASPTQSLCTSPPTFEDPVLNQQFKATENKSIYDVHVNTDQQYACNLTLDDYFFSFMKHRYLICFNILSNMFQFFILGLVSPFFVMSFSKINLWKFHQRVSSSKTGGEWLLNNNIHMIMRFSRYVRAYLYQYLSFTWLWRLWAKLTAFRSH